MIKVTIDQYDPESPPIILSVDYGANVFRRKHFIFENLKELEIVYKKMGNYILEKHNWDEKEIE